MSQPPAMPPGADAADRVQRFGKYFLVRKLAEGGMAEIFLAKSLGAEGFERDVVIKRMLKHLTGVPDFVNMFMDEAKLAARLAHQNVVQIHELGLAEGCYYICMEYLAGEDFSTILRTAGRRHEYVPLQLALRVIADAAHGLHYAHESTDELGNPLHIVHRDVSPSNIFVTYEGQVKVLDFGIARAESRLAQTTAGVVKGKYMYMSPEQARGKVVDRRADVFSLGVSLFEALTHKRPFAHDNDLAILNAVLSGDFPRPRALRPELSVELEQIVLKAMAHKPEERYATAAELAEAIDRYLTSSTTNVGGAQLSSYLRGLVGEARVFRKKNVQRLNTLVESGQIARGFTNPEMPTVATAASASELGTRVHGTPSSAVSRKRATWVMPLVLLGVVALAGAGVFGWKQLPSAASPAAEAPPPAVKAPQAPGVVAAPADAGVDQPAVAVGAPDAGAEAPTPEVTSARVQPANTRRKPVKLTPTAVHSVLARSRARSERCFVANRTELPSKKGQLHVQFSIESSGRVSGVQVNAPFAGTKVGRCLADVVSKLKFPAHVDGPIALTAPFEYTTPE